MISLTFTIFTTIRLSASVLASTTASAEHFFLLILEFGSLRQTHSLYRLFNFRLIDSARNCKMNAVSGGGSLCFTERLKQAAVENLSTTATSGHRLSLSLSLYLVLPHCTHTVLMMHTQLQLQLQLMAHHGHWLFILTTTAAAALESL